jgi:hypothetical protein
LLVLAEFPPLTSAGRQVTMQDKASRATGLAGTSAMRRD